MKKKNERADSLNKNHSKTIELKTDTVDQSTEPFLPRALKKNLQSGYFSFIKCCKRVIKEQKPRVIHLSGEVLPKNRVKNVVKNQKYSIITFLPYVLWNQFKIFFNFFFLLITLSQFIPELQVGFLFTYLTPLVFVIMLTMIKEFFEDYQRYKRDKEANSAQYNIFTSKGYIIKKSSELKVGDVIEVNANQRIPADLLLLQTNDRKGSIFIKTDQLDGETDWKLRKAVSITQKFAEDFGLTSIVSNKISVVANPPSESIYEFTGIIKDSETETTESLNLENTLWANTVLASGKIFGLVMFTGYETRMALNTRAPRSKFCLFDQELNKLSVMLFFFLVFLSTLMVILGGVSFSWNSMIQFCRYILLLNSIIPISMRVNLEFAKLIYSFKISHDTDIPETIARNSNIAEDLGRIQFLLTDKTGTLTQNDMNFKKLSLEDKTYSFESSRGEITKYLEKVYKKYNDGYFGIPRNSLEERRLDMEEDHKLLISSIGFKSFSSNRTIKVEKELILKDLIVALAVCHNVTPNYEQDDMGQNKKIYQASSPDEISLVKMAEEVGLSLVSRDQNEIVIQNPLGNIDRYRVLANFPFSSETKRMGIVVQQTFTNQIIFYVKGADIALKPMIDRHKASFMLEECENLAREGLRTLGVAQRYLSKREFDDWFKHYTEANSSLTDRESKIRKAIARLEKDLDFLGVTGVEDKLQDEVYQTLDNLRNAGIKIWMLTGDKVATAICVAISAGLKSPTQNYFLIENIVDEQEFERKLLEYSPLSQTGYILIIDGTSLTVAFDSNSTLFLEVTTKAPAVVCCRCSPTQKSQIIEKIKEFTKVRTAAVGDGGNDVGMIQLADVGIGIVGKEGMQAALAADFSINQFKYLNKLLLWHGRLAYKRSAKLSQFVIHRGMILSFIQVVFTSVFYFIAFPIYNGMLMLGYTTIYTTLPVFCLVFDEDVDVETALQFPPLYTTLQKGRELNTLTFCSWMWKSLYQGSVIMFLAAIVYEDIYLNIVTITFSALILTEFLNIYSELHSVHVVQVISQLLSAAIYFLSVIILKKLFDVSYFTWTFAWKIIAVTLISWAPIHFWRLFMKWFDPTDYEKIMKSVKSNRSMIQQGFKN